MIGFSDSDRPVASADIFINVMVKVYMWMSIGLLFTAATAWLVSANEMLLQMIYGNLAIFYGLLIGELILIMLLSFLIDKAPFVVNALGFLLYSVLNGATLAVIFLLYAQKTIVSAFLVSFMAFAVMSIYGYITKKNLTGIGSFLMMGLLGLIVAGIVNIFIQNDMFGFIVSLAGIVIFVGLVACHTQKIKERLAMVRSEEQVNKVALDGALTLYLDFINMFLRILQIMGKKK